MVEEGIVAVSEASMGHASTTPQLSLLPTTAINSSQLETTTISTTAVLHTVRVNHADSTPGVVPVNDDDDDSDYDANHG